LALAGTLAGAFLIHSNFLGIKNSLSAVASGERQEEQRHEKEAEGQLCRFAGPACRGSPRGACATATAGPAPDSGAREAPCAAADLMAGSTRSRFDPRVRRLDVMPARAFLRN
jgi:hypothetical protein